MKCDDCKIKKYRLRCLKCEQEADHGWVWPESIAQIKDGRFKELSDKQLVYLMAHIVGRLTLQRVAKVMGVSHQGVSKVISRSKEKLKRLKIF